MLDFSHTTSAADIQDRFDTIVSTLLRHYQLFVFPDGKDRTVYKFLEVEFYLYQPGCHEDPFTHRSHEQQTAGEWCASLSITHSSTDQVTGTFTGRRDVPEANTPPKRKAAATVVGRGKDLISRSALFRTLTPVKLLTISEQ